jgi:hypothetical protein
MITLSLIISVLSLVTTITVAVVVYVKLKSIYINLFNLSKGLDVLFSNQDKIIELTKIKSFIQLTNEEEREVRNQVSKEKQVFGKREKDEEPVRSSEPDTDNEGY